MIILKLDFMIIIAIILKLIESNGCTSIKEEENIIYLFYFYYFICTIRYIELQNNNN